MLVGAEMKGLLLIVLCWLTLASGPTNALRFQRDTYIFMEGSGEGRVCVVGRPRGDNLRVQIREVPQRDLRSRVLEFSGTGNKQTQCINFPIMDNEVALEEMKTITLALSVPDGQRDMVEGDLPQTHIIILDDDELGISLDPDSDVPEDIGSVDVCVTFDKPFASRFQLETFLSQNRSIESPAVSPEEDIDITALAANLPILPGSRRECFSIPVHNDQEPEEKECFVIKIALAVDAPEMAVIKRDSVTYCIIDDDLAPTSATSITPTSTPEVIPNAVDRVNEDIDDLNRILEELEETPLSQNRSKEFASEASDVIEEILAAELTEADRAALGSSLLMTLDQFALEAPADGITLVEDDAMNIRLEIQEVAPDVASPITGVTAEGNSIVLPPELFRSVGFASEVRVAAFYYRSLTGVLPNSLPDTDANTVLFSSVLSAALQCGDRRCDMADLELDSPVRITFSHTRVEENSTSLCVFWEFTAGSSSSGDVSGRWSREGCTRNDEESEPTRTVCECNHLTHFAILLSPRALEISSEDEFALRIIGYVGFSLSLVGLLLTIAAYVFMSSLWNIQSYVLVNLCINLLAAHIIFIAGIERTENKDACSSVAVLLHYFFLVAFMWMLMEGVALYLLLVKVFNYSSRNAILVFTILSYGVPAVYMGITIPLGFVVPEDGGRYYGTSEACWLDTGSGFVWAFIAPVMVIIVINTGFFIMTIAVIYRHGKRTDMEYSATTWLRTAVSLMVVMGITWVFGVLVFYESLLVFAYINAVMVAFQGFAIFVLFVPLQKRVRDAYVSWWKGPAVLGPIITIHPSTSTSTSTSTQQKSPFFNAAGTTSENVFLSYFGSLENPDETELKTEVQADPQMMSSSPKDSPEPPGTATTSTIL